MASELSPIADRREAALSDEEKWQALCNRDENADGLFIYAVVTTGVYCRLGCAARRPLRKNVRFYPDIASAEAAGYRACKRCKPNEPHRDSREAEIVARTCARIEHYGGYLPLEDLARLEGLSPFHFHRLFKRVTGVTPGAYTASWRTQKVKQELSQGENVTGAIYAAGYGSPSRFYETAQRRLGMQPSLYRNGGRNAHIRFAVGECALGSILVAASGGGVCEVKLADDPETLVRELQDRFPHAELTGDDEQFRKLVRIIVSLIEEPTSSVRLPLDVRGTAFQERVWRALQEIPLGETRSYAEIARAIGSPSATRAVAQACAANKIAVLIPCHRVVRTDGAPGGYRWGIDRKRALLQREAAAPGTKNTRQLD